MSIIRCNCDTCGKAATCSTDEAAPAGWFFFEVRDELGSDIVTVLACSEKCRALPWKKQRAKKGAS